ncbi:MAG: HAMP domain-containing histidine kinase [Bacillaceae bacterium]|nr:HAMP domain-containing histidine kinase [Bacillaceae bacterium]
MRHFLKDMLPFTLFFYSQVFLISITAYLILSIYDAGHTLETFLYMMGAPSFFYAIFLFVQYRKFQLFYRPDQGERKEKDSLSPWMPESDVILLATLKERFEQQYQRYQTELNKTHENHQKHLRFIQQWVHQMKTPLSVMNLTLQNEKETIPSPLYHDLSEELDRLKEGLDLALYHARLDSFNRDFQVKKVKLLDLIRETIDNYKRSFIRNRVYPEVHIDNRLMVETDPKWFSFVMNQITSNAIKYSSGSNQKIIYQTDCRGRECHLSVQDYGEGIPKKDLPRIFDPFFTGENGRRFRESTGMGLYLVKQVCDEMGHEISVSSEEGKGTAVTITFPHVTKM